MSQFRDMTAVLVLADGTKFRGISIGFPGLTVGEVVFNTSMTGYQEILTDPSYTKQIITLTYPHIGNVGVNHEDIESEQVYASGLIIRDLSMINSNFRSEQTLLEYLKASHIVAIANIDTRKLTRHLRKHGSQPGSIIAESLDVQKAHEEAKAFPGLSGMDLAKVVSAKKAYTFDQGQWSLSEGYSIQKESDYHVVAFDYGIKKNILRMLVSRRCKVTVVPAVTSYEEVVRLKPDGILLSNGPGDPEPCDYAIKAIKQLVDDGYPTFGICLGHQLLALASGAKTTKMKFGHHGANHPVQDLKTKRVFITSQNHGFTVDPSTLPKNLVATHQSLFDGSLQGIERLDRPAFSFQGHPEASPGPSEMSYLFDHFIALIEKKKTSNAKA
jgi:carbamoyl-phosphate synthase small subunit